MIFSLFIACLTNGTYGTGDLNPNDDGYQWGSSPHESGDSGATQEANSDPDNTAIGYSVGQRAPNLQATDQLGAPWSLYDQNAPLLLMFGHLDNNAFPMMLAQAKALDVEILTCALAGRNIYSSPASPNDASLVANEYTIDVVLTDGSQALVNEWSERNPPKAYLLSADQIILWSAFQSLDEAAFNQLLE